MARRRLVALLATLALLACLLGTGWWFGSGRYEATPSLTQMGQSQAQGVIEANGLSAELRREYSERIAKGIVVRTEPAAGERIVRHGTVVAYVSAGPERHAMPTVKGLSRAAAVQALQAASLAVGDVGERWSEQTPAGQVMQASQQPGAKLRRDTRVDLVISKGPEPIAIATTTGTDATSAARTLRRAGFVVTTTRQSSDTVARGAVVSQNPAGGTGRRGDRIALVVSTGPAMTAVPQVGGLTEAQATKALAAAGFTANVNHVTPSWLREDKVQAVIPGAGSMARTGSTVNLWVI